MTKRNEVDQHEVSIMQTAEYWTSVYHVGGGRPHRLEHATFIDAAKQADILLSDKQLTKALIYAVRGPNGALAVTYYEGKWHLTNLRGIEHPLKNFVVDGKVVYE